MTELEIPELPLPQKGKKLFAPAPDWQHNACLGWMRESLLWDAQAEGFKLAAFQLVDDVVERRAHPIDVLVYPIVFLFRHYLELRLKELIIVSARLLDKPREVPGHHDLTRLWAVVRPRIERVWPEDSVREQLDAVEETLRGFCDVDPDSQAFRYPVDRAGKLSVTGLDHINVRHLKDVIAGVSSLLDSSSIGMGEYLNAKHEMLAEYRSEMGQFYEP